MAIFVGWTERSFRESPQFKVAFYHWFTKCLKQFQKGRPHFSQAPPNWECYECPKQSFVSAISVWKICAEAVVPNTFVTADRSTLDKFTAAREYSCNSVSMGRIDQSHTQKESGGATSMHFQISPPRDWGPLP